MTKIIPLPDLALNRGHYLKRVGPPCGWMLFDASGPIRPLSWFESRFVEAASAPDPQVAEVLDKAAAALREYAKRDDNQLDKLLAASREAAGNPRMSRGFVAGLQAAHALLSGAGDLDALARRAASLERARAPLDMLIMAAMLGAGMGAAFAFVLT
jgi:hypothetical protein